MTQFPTSDDTPVAGRQVERFMGLFAAHQRRIYGYIRVMVPRPGDAEDVYQETLMAMWRMFEQFQPGTDFAAWALKVAKLRVLEYRHRTKRDAGPAFDPATLDLLADDMHALGPQLDHRLEALRSCMNDLEPGHRQLIDLRYQQDASVESIAQQLGRSSKTIYRMLSAAHQALLACVRRRMAEQV
ncbi:MAG: sigma-70 family RNA polymerase sigma factor [Planctomycetes bacterium]|nr:sigma-70 family RNA polymerase sigma factor [Planctomycetota bacterium]